MADMARSWHLAMWFLFPQGKEGVNAVDDPIGAVWVRVEDLGMAINPGHGSAAVSDFARNTEGSIVGNIEGKVAVVLTAAPLRHRYGRLFCIAVGLPTNSLSSYGQYGLSPY